MITPITRRDVIAHQSVVPWPSQVQVEQDLLLCRAMVTLFDDAFLQGQIAMRGGILLHKVHLAPASRYSEDIDLVVFGDRPVPKSQIDRNNSFTHSLALFSSGRSAEQKLQRKNRIVARSWRFT